MSFFLLYRVKRFLGVCYSVYAIKHLIDNKRKKDITMKNNNMNNNNMIMNEDMIKAIVAQAMAQGIKAGMAQAMQAQAMGAGDAGKALPVSLPNKAQAQGKGKAQGKAQAGKAQAQAQGIEYIACKRSEEKALIGMVRDALIAGNESDCLSLIKAWHVMVNKDKTVTNDTIVALYRNLCKVAFDGKYATVKGTKDACMVCKSCGRIKAWLYTFNRGDVKIIG